MECPNCKADNSEAKRFCTTCGSPLGTLCRRCGKIGKLEDKYCGECGMTLSASPNEHLFKRAPQTGATKQYMPDEIEELLQMRKQVVDEQSASERVTQNDIDSIFN
ncbi:MAG TPA: zinc ribbon domain-containing protein [Bacteroidota bacterium]|nr:zinc ribbon domain-containing protein [Bacteroidota bacterium]